MKTIKYNIWGKWLTGCIINAKVNMNPFGDNNKLLSDVMDSFGERIDAANVLEPPPLSIGSFIKELQSITKRKNIIDDIGTNRLGILFDELFNIRNPKMNLTVTNDPFDALENGRVTTQELNEFEQSLKTTKTETKGTNKMATKKSMQERMMNKMFKKVDDVVIDMTNSSIGIKRNDSIFTMAKGEEEGEFFLSENMFEEMSVSVPAFAQPKALNDIKPGDLVLDSKGDVFGWATKIMPKSLKIMKPTGVESSVVPAKANLMGQGQTMMVISSMFGDDMQSALPMIMMLSESDDSGDKMDKLIPAMMMSQQGGGDMNAIMPMLMMMGDDVDSMLPMLMMMGQQPTAKEGQQATPGMDPMMMAMMMSGDKDKKGGKSDGMAKMMMMQSMMGGQQGQQAGAMNPMMMMAMMGKI